MDLYLANPAVADVCGNCGCADFLVDEHRGTYTCEECGCVDSAPILKATGAYKESFDCTGTRRHTAPVFESVVSGVYHTTAALDMAQSRPRGNSPPYRRETYWSERISQWRLQEPDFVEGDSQRIEEKWQQLSGYFGGIERHARFANVNWERGVDGAMRTVPRFVLDKEDCRAILWSIDSDIETAGGKPTFVKRYLEKFLTIRKNLCGVTSYGYGVSDEFVEWLKTMFRQLQNPFEDIVRRSKVRYSFINYNFLFRRFFDLAGVSHYGRDFPPLKSKKKREDIILLYLKLISVTKWPYLNNDGALFGAAYDTDIKQLQQRQSEQERRSAARQAAADAKSSHNRLRREHEDRAREQRDQKLREQAMSEFLDALFSVICSDGGGTSYDDFSNK